LPARVSSWSIRGQSQPEAAVNAVIARSRTRDRHLTIAVLAVMLGLLVAMFGNASSVSASRAYFPLLTGSEEVPGPGDPDGEGAAQIDVDPANGTVCATWDLVDIDSATAAHIHAGAAGVSGAVVVTLPTPEADGSGGDCVSGQDTAVLQAIVDDPDAYYVNVHTDPFPDGAIRGQLGEAVEFFQLLVSVVACPADHVIAPVFDGLPEGCVSVLQPENVPDLPPGYSFDIEPLAADLEFEIADGGDPLTTADGSWDGGSTCNTVTLVCSVGGSFVWGQVFSGDTSIRQLAGPAGYRLAGATIFRDNDAGAVLGLSSTSTVTFDSRGTDSIFIRLYDLAGAAPVPTTTVTVPPTSSDEPASSGSLSAIPAILVVGLTASAAVLMTLTVPHRPKRRR
jgi:CHRD domain